MGNENKGTPKPEAEVTPKDDTPAPEMESWDWSKGPPDQQDLTPEQVATIEHCSKTCLFMFGRYSLTPAEALAVVELLGGHVGNVLGATIFLTAIRITDIQSDDESRVKPKFSPSSDPPTGGTWI